MEWLVERGVVKAIYTSFLPLGHTHFDPDQLASCISEAIKNTDITSIDQLTKLIQKCFTPNPHVVFLDGVMDWRKLINPENNPNFPVRTAMCRPARGLCTKIPPKVKKRREYMMEQSDLHWRILADNYGHPFLQTKYCVDDECWSEAVRHWDTKAPRPENRACDTNASGLLPTDLTWAPRKPLDETRLAELRLTIPLCEDRTSMSASDYEAFMSVLDELANPTEQADLVLPEHRWSFMCESKEERPPVSNGMVDSLRMPSRHVVRNLNLQNANRVDRRMGIDNDILAKGLFLAVHPNYTADYDEEKKQEFWLAKIDKIHQEEKRVDITYWNTGTTNNASYRKGQTVAYRVYTGPGVQQEGIPLSRIIIQIKELTAKKAVHINDRRRILAAFAAAEAEAAAAAAVAAAAAASTDTEDAVSDEDE